MTFPYKQYETLDEQLTVYYPRGQAELARQLFQEIKQASKLLRDLLGLSMPDLEILVVAAGDWKDVPLEDDEETEPPETMLPYWTETTKTPTLVVPEQMDEIMGEASPEKRSLLLY